MPKIVSINNFIEKAILLHGNKYDYSLVDYKASSNKIKIICPTHSVFEQKPNNHLNGSGCPKCGFNVIHSMNLSNNDDFISDSIKIHGDKYDYSLVEYINSKYKIKIVCKNHDVFEQTPAHHLEGSGCPKCGSINGHFKQIKTKSNFINAAIIKHGVKFDYSHVIYINAKTKIKIGCPIHGVFEQIPNSHLHGIGCPKCNESKGEMEIRKFLIENNIIFISQKRFKNCRYKGELRFDFYLPNYNICIEYDGKQHYEPINIWGGIKTLLDIQIKDTIKTNYCKDNNLYLIRVNYKENDVKSSLNDKLMIFINKN